MKRLIYLLSSTFIVGFSFLIITVSYYLFYSEGSYIYRVDGSKYLIDGEIEVSNSIKRSELIDILGLYQTYLGFLNGDVNSEHLFSPRMLGILGYSVENLNNAILAHGKVQIIQKLSEGLFRLEAEESFFSYGRDPVTLDVYYDLVYVRGVPVIDFVEGSVKVVD